MFTNKKRTGINTFVCAVSLYVAETPKATIKDHEPVFPKIPFGIVAYGFVGQPFSKQLYTTATVRTTFSKKCVSVSDFALEFRIYLKLSSVSVGIKSCP